MPTYEYECESCGRRFDKFQSIMADPLEECIYEDCEPPGKVRRLIGTGGAILFKGSGFYETDYRSKDYHSKKEAESGSPAAKPSSDSSSKESTSSDSTSSSAASTSSSDDS